MSIARPKKTFSQIIRNEPLVLVDFYTEWCGPCKMMKPILEDFHQQMGDQVRILKVDVDKNPKAAQIYQIRGVPTLALFKKGEIVWRQSGVVPVSLLKEIVTAHRSN
jgi:thioredoxin 1